MNAQANILYNEFKNHTFKIIDISPRVSEMRLIEMNSHIKIDRLGESSK